MVPDVLAASAAAAPLIAPPLAQPEPRAASPRAPVVAEPPARSAAAAALPLASLEERIACVVDDKRPARKPNPTDAERMRLEEIAKLSREDVELGPAARRALNCLGDVAWSGNPEHLKRVREHFFVSRDGTFELAAPQLPARAALGMESPNTRSFRDGWKHTPAAFENVVGQIAAKASFLAPVFNDAREKGWGRMFFTDLGQRLAQCPPGGGVHYKLWFPDAYGADITHIADVVFTPEGGMLVAEQTTYSHLSLVKTSFETAEDVERFHLLAGKMPPPDGPAKSFARHGGPMMQFCGDVTRQKFDDLRTRTEEVAQWCQRPENFQFMYYASNADPELAAAGQAIRKDCQAGRPPSREHSELLMQRRFEKIPPSAPPHYPPGERLAWNWNCQYFSLWASDVLGQLKDDVQVTRSMKHHDVALLLLKEGWSPCTPLNLRQLIGLHEKARPSDKEIFDRTGRIQCKWPNLVKEGNAYPPTIPTGRECGSGDSRL
jgi:hypothetical protein